MSLSRKSLSFSFALLLTFSPYLSTAATPTADARRPLLSILDQFENAPATGPAEAEIPTRPLPDATNSSPSTPLPGRGLGQHPFLYYGEGNNVLYVVNHGKVIWKYAFPKGGEIDDAWMLSDGHIVNEMLDPTAQRVLDHLKQLGG